MMPPGFSIRYNDNEAAVLHPNTGSTQAALSIGLPEDEAYAQY